MPSSDRASHPVLGPADTGAVGTGDDWVAVGVVRGAFGVQGALKVEPYADVESSVLNHVRHWRITSRPLRLTGIGGSSEESSAEPVADSRRVAFPLPAKVVVQASKQHGGSIIATIAPAITREQALALKGCEVLVHRADFPAADPDEYYWTDLIGCEVSDTAGAPLGCVVAVDDHGAQSVLRLDNGMLIPFVSAFVLEVSTREKRIVADWSADWA
ncbi:MAG TPA: ribosome maturation factor RimM [Lautropia sp.]|nr:ribosome maturation factor RimM [Lautropia sp.]